MNEHGGWMSCIPHSDGDDDVFSLFGARKCAKICHSLLVQRIQSEMTFFQSRFCRFDFFPLFAWIIWTTLRLLRVRSVAERVTDRACADVWVATNGLTPSHYSSSRRKNWLRSISLFTITWAMPESHSAHEPCHRFASGNQSTFERFRGPRISIVLHWQ